jgi:regulator of cell morphogenesis and NO signaling
MAILNPDTTVGQYVLEQPDLSRVFEKFGIDFCCGGKRTLEEVCREKGLKIDEVFKALHEAGMMPDTENIDWHNASMNEMVDHIFETHHQYLYNEFPRLLRMVNKVAKVHGENDSRLVQLEAAYEQLVSELMLHMRKEEHVLFPYCRALENSVSGLPNFHCGGIGNPIRVMEMEHQTTGKLLERMRALTDGYSPPEWACNTYRAMLDGLKEMEADIHRHIHEENNILFPAALQKADLLASPGNRKA